jgi:hypothetical protein
MSDTAYLIVTSVLLNFLLIYIIFNLMKRISAMQKGLDDIRKTASSFQKMPKKPTAPLPAKK